jgi:hypothetical protein
LDHQKVLVSRKEIFLESVDKKAARVNKLLHYIEKPLEVRGAFFMYEIPEISSFALSKRLHFN